jgi:hypothetical protein
VKGDELLLLHLALLDEPEDRDERPSAQARLEGELGPEVARELLVALVRR